MRYKILIVLAVIAVFLISGCVEELSRAEAEELAVKEVKRIYRESAAELEATIEENPSLSWTSGLIEVTQSSVEKAHAVHSIKKGDSWIVYIAFESEAAVMEAYVSSSGDVLIPDLEE